MFNILVCFILILDIFILIDSRLRHTILYLMIFHCIVSYRVCIWFLIILSLHIASHQDAYCTMPDHIMLYWSILCLIMECCYMVLYYIRYYTSLKQDSLHHVILPKINYKIKRHTVLCHSKNTAFYHHVSLHSVLCPWVARNTTLYNYYLLYVLYCLCTVYSFMRFEIYGFVPYFELLFRLMLPDPD